MNCQESELIVRTPSTTVDASETRICSLDRAQYSVRTAFLVMCLLIGIADAFAEGSGEEQTQSHTDDVQEQDSRAPGDLIAPRNSGDSSGGEGQDPDSLESGTPAGNSTTSTEKTQTLHLPADHDHGVDGKGRDRDAHGEKINQQLDRF